MNDAFLVREFSNLNNGNHTF